MLTGSLSLIISAEVSGVVSTLGEATSNKNIRVLEWAAYPLDTISDAR